MDFNDLVDKALTIHRRDLADMTQLYNYRHGDQASPYAARGYTDEFRALSKRAVTNWVSLAVNIPCQMSIIEGYRVRGDSDPDEWEAFKGNRMERKQYAIHDAAATFGHSFAEVVMPGPLDRTSDNVLIPPVKTLPTRSTVVLYEDAFSDRFPVFAMRLDNVPDSNGHQSATVWHGLDKMRIKWDAAGGSRSVTVVDGSRHAHGFPVVPIVRWVVRQDLEGNTKGLVAPLIQPQDETNQAKFDLTVTRNFSSYKVRWATGMEGEPLLDENGQHVIDEASGEPIYVAPEIGPETMVTSEDDKTRFGTLDETPLDGFIDSLNQSVEHFAAVSQIPPHALQGRMVNLSADALVAAEEQLMRLVESLQRSWGDSWATLFQLIAYAQGQSGALYDFSGTVRWRDMRASSLSETVDALGKAAQMLNIPAPELWKFFPRADAATIQEWREAFDAQPAPELDQSASVSNFGRTLSGMSRTQRSDVGARVPRRRAG